MMSGGERLRAMAVVLGLAILVGCCSREEARPSVAEYAKRLKPLLEAAPKSVIDLDGVEPEVIYPDLVIPRDTTQKEGGLFLAQPSGILVLRDSIYITDAKDHCIKVADMEGNLIRTIGRRGQGPGEFNQPWEIVANDSFVFVYDVGNSRVQIFAHDFRYVASLPALYMLLPPVGGLAAGNRNLLVHGFVTDSMLVRVYRAQRPFSLCYAFLPLVVPYRRQPRVMNSVALASTPDGRFCVGFVCLPYALVFDSTGTQVATLEFRGRAVKRLDEPVSAKRLAGVPPGAGRRRFMGSIRIEGNWGVRTLVISGPDVADLLFLQRHGESYRLEKRLRLPNTFSEPFFLSEDALYVAMDWRGMVYRYKLKGEGL
ncbi:MAG: 6-bladed beta-propeller [candidate division KSB1 bacterium]|nr:6-bladed beta-propeller [candidate division KSB1 bacterium]